MTGLLAQAAAVLRVPFDECGRLAALPYMLRRGRLRRKLGDDSADHLLALAQELPIADQPSNEWLEPLTGLHQIDPGEAQLLAASAEHKSWIVMSDKRAVLAVKEASGFPLALDRRVVVLEAILLELCTRLGPHAVLDRVGGLMQIDVTMKICFSSASPEKCLWSYFNDLASLASPLRLWQPPSVQVT